MKPLATPLILVVDDQSANVQLMGKLLDVAGYHVIPALNGKEAIARAQARAPDLVLTDMRMPEMDGFETCRRLREIPGLGDLPVIFVTAATEHEYLTQAFQAGAVDYVTKPFIAEELLARVKLHTDLKRTRDHLTAMLRERDDITNVVAHDLKNPLTCVRFAAQMLQRDSDDPLRRAELIQEILDCSGEALNFIQRYLSRSAAGEYLREFTAEPVALQQLARDAAHFQKSAADIRQVAVSISGEAPPVMADPMATRNVLQNLISNALRHSPAGETVELQISCERSGYACCRVLDRGPGIAEADQKKLFQRFMRLATAKETEFSSGLGLAIAKHDITQMGGYLWYSLREGGGSVFGFELPLQA